MKVSRALIGACLTGMLWIAGGGGMVLAADSVSSSTGAYRLGPEDVLQVSVWKEKDLQLQVVVLPDGTISFPLVDTIQAAGRTVAQVQAEIVQKLKKYMPDPVVSVSVLKLGAYRVYVIGKVNKPGEYPVGRYIDVMQALSLAGGLTPFASEDKIKILRRKNGHDTVIPFHYSDVADGKSLAQNVMLQSGDVVVVQ